jgi:hypothetical protein
MFRWTFVGKGPNGDDLIVKNNAGYLNLEIYLAYIGGDFEILLGLPSVPTAAPGTTPKPATTSPSSTPSPKTTPSPSRMHVFIIIVVVL